MTLTSRSLAGAWDDMMTSELDDRADTTLARPGVHLPRRREILEREADRSEDRDLVVTRATRLHACDHLAQLGVNRVGSQPRARDRAHARRQVAVIADEQRARDQPRIDL